MCSHRNAAVVGGSFDANQCGHGKRISLRYDTRIGHSGAAGGCHALMDAYGTQDVRVYKFQSTRGWSGRDIGCVTTIHRQHCCGWSVGGINDSVLSILCFSCSPLLPCWRVERGRVALIRAGVVKCQAPITHVWYVSESMLGTRNTSTISGKVSHTIERTR